MSARATTSTVHLLCVYASSTQAMTPSVWMSLILTKNERLSGASQKLFTGAHVRDSDSHFRQQAFSK